MSSFESIACVLADLRMMQLKMMKIRNDRWTKQWQKRDKVLPTEKGLKAEQAAKDAAAEEVSNLRPGEARDSTPGHG